MEMIDRYLNAVGFWLPKKQKKDILAELEGDLKAEIEEREAGLGRKLVDAEVDEILKRRGAPILAAGRYLPQRSLIGPVLFPIYTFVLKIVLFFYLVPWFAVWLFAAVFIPSFRAAHPGPELLESLSTLWDIALSAFATITIGFAAAEWFRVPDRIAGKWAPRDLPKVRDVRKIPRSESAPLFPMSTTKGEISRLRRTSPPARVTCLERSTRRVLLRAMASWSSVATPSWATQQSIALLSQSS